MTESTPAPNPDRAIYGFVLYLVCCLSFAGYVVWAYLPASYLNAIGLTYLPSKYWAIAIPVYVGMPLVLVGFCVYPAMNFMTTRSLNSIACTTDGHAKPVLEPTNPKSIPAIGDIDIKDVCQKLYGSEISKGRKSRKKSKVKH